MGLVVAWRRVALRLVFVCSDLRAPQLWKRYLWVLLHHSFHCFSASVILPDSLPNLGGVFYRVFGVKSIVLNFWNFVWPYHGCLFHTIFYKSASTAIKLQRSSQTWDTAEVVRAKPHVGRTLTWFVRLWLLGSDIWIIRLFFKRLYRWLWHLSFDSEVLNEL